MDIRPDHDPRIAAVLHDMTRVGRRVTGIDVVVRQLIADVAGLARAARTTPPEDRPGEVRAWLLTEDPAPVLTRAALPGAALSSYWIGHPVAVEELAGPRGRLQLRVRIADQPRPGVAPVSPPVSQRESGSALGGRASLALLTRAPISALTRDAEPQYEPAHRG